MKCEDDSYSETLLSFGNPGLLEALYNRRSGDDVDIHLSLFRLSVAGRAVSGR
jgi:hypothetical protein